MSKLSNVQIALKAPKNQKNNFGGYNYRNCEDIMEAVKPLLDKEGLTLIITDCIVQVADRYYVRADCVLFDGDKVVANVSGFAREPLDRKGMDASQITGASSSYARKYALGGMFLIDDTKDPDATNDHGKPEPGRSQSYGKQSQEYKPVSEKKPTPPGTTESYTIRGVTKDTKNGQFWVKVVGGGPFMTTKEVLAQVAKDNIGKSCSINYTVDSEMVNVMLNIDPD